MFDHPQYLTKGVQDTLPCWGILLLWQLIAQMPEPKDCLQIFRLTSSADGQRICHEQEDPPYRCEYVIPCRDAVDTKVYVIDDGTHCTMLLVEEY